MTEDGVSFAKEVLSDPSVEHLKDQKINKVSTKIDPITDFDHDQLDKKKSFKSLLNLKNLKDFLESSYNFAKFLNKNIGINNVEIHFKPGDNKDEIKVKYNLGPTISRITFPYFTKKNSFLIQGEYYKRGAESDKFLQSLVSGSLLGRYNYNFFDNGHSIGIEKIWEDCLMELDTSIKAKYRRKWLDANIKEECWSKAIKFMYDMGPSSNIFKNYYLIRPMDYIYAKLSHKSRKNFIDTTHCTGELIRSGYYPDSLLSFKFGYKTQEDFLLGTKILVKNYVELASNDVDDPFLKYKLYIKNYTPKMAGRFAAFTHSFLLEKIFASEQLRINDSCFLKGMHGIYEFPGAKANKNLISGMEHVGDRVANDLIALYEAQLIFPNLKPLSSVTTHLLPYIYGTLGYSQPINNKYAGKNYKDSMMGSIGFGIKLLLTPIQVGFYYSIAGFRPKHDLGKEYGFYIGI